MPSEKIFFIDGVHPHYNPMPAYSWIEKGQPKNCRKSAENGYFF
ncbi:MAG: hypothetical protein JETT_0805 [Candidatus Jettenia ecosi]|uniref:Uncharacterized protein n=1 Tax=Candidatus Jettenia ecosi TaxID=2494326 RepID=A0A533QDS9_9BACT|nr:MAG: hypothetical protein JETT_0805 [Candidatus Jettenia ecosi]